MAFFSLFLNIYSYKDKSSLFTVMHGQKSVRERGFSREGFEMRWLEKRAEGVS
jgi:hypothetical protein